MIINNGILNFAFYLLHWWKDLVTYGKTQMKEERHRQRETFGTWEKQARGYWEEEGKKLQRLQDTQMNFDLRNRVQKIDHKTWKMSQQAEHLMVAKRRTLGMVVKIVA